MYNEPSLVPQTNVSELIKPAEVKLVTELPFNVHFFYCKIPSLNYHLTTSLSVAITTKASPGEASASIIVFDDPFSLESNLQLSAKSYKYAVFSLSNENIRILVSTLENATCLAALAPLGNTIFAIGSKLNASHIYTTGLEPTDPVAIIFLLGCISIDTISSLCPGLYNSPPPKNHYYLEFLSITIPNAAAGYIICSPL